MTRIIATVCALAGLLAGPPTALAAAAPTFDLGDLPIVGPVVTGLLGDDPDPVDPGTPVDPTPVDPTDPLPTDPVGTDPGGTDPGGTDPGTGTTPPDSGTSVPDLPGTTTGGSSTGTASNGGSTATSSGTAVPSGAQRWVTIASRRAATGGTAPTSTTTTGGTASTTTTSSGFPLLQPVEGQDLTFTAPPSATESSSRASDVVPAPRFDSGLLLLIGLVLAAGVAFTARGVWRRSALR